MKNMFDLDLQQILTSFIGTFLAGFFAGFVWIFKTLHDRHKSEKLALAKYEQFFAYNLTVLKDNFDFVNEWMKSMEEDKPYSVNFRNFYINNEDVDKFSNLKLLNKILDLNYKLTSVSLDIDNIYKYYWEQIIKIDSIKTEEEKKDNLKIFQDNIKNVLEQIKLNHKPLENNAIEIIAFIRVIDKVRFHSFFGYVGLLFKDVFPRVNDKLISEHIKNIAENKVKNKN